MMVTHRPGPWVYPRRTYHRAQLTPKPKPLDAQAAPALVAAVDALRTSGYAACRVDPALRIHDVRQRFGLTWHAAQRAVLLAQEPLP